MNVKLENVSFSYNPDLSQDNYTLNNINLSINKGEFVLICGRSGSGKTTLAQIIAGLLNATDGEVYFNGRNAAGHSSKILRKSIGMVFQTPEQQLFEKTVYEDITFVLRMDGNISDTQINELTPNVLRMVGLDYEQYKDRLSFSLSSGERRKVAIACILINSPRLIILDEPTVGLDYHTQKSLIKIIKKLHEDGKTIVCISHDINNFLDFSSRILVLRKGEVIFAENKETLFHKYDIIKEDVKLPDILEVLHELKKLDGDIVKDVYSASEALTYLKNLVK